MSVVPTITDVTSPAREIAAGVWWLPACLQLDAGSTSVHLHNAPYLLMGAEKTLLWDTAPPANWDGIAAELDSLLGDRPIDYLVPSHPEEPHCGNLRRLLTKYPDAHVLGDVRDYHLYFPAEADRLVQLDAGSEVDLGGGTRFIFLSAIVKDLPSSQWGYLPEQQVLFTADAFAYSHRPPFGDEDRPVHTSDECGRLASELGVAPGPEQIVWITRAALYWAQFMTMDMYRVRFTELLRSHPTKLVAPAHGAVIDDMSILDMVWDALSLAYDPVAATRRAGTYVPTVGR